MLTILAAVLVALGAVLSVCRGRECAGLALLVIGVLLAASL